MGGTRGRGKTKQMENNVPKVSVIIPVYNTENYLRKCLDSVCNQTLKDIEIICINDCSPDGCLDILREYASKDARIKIIDFKENKGVAIARNRGIEVATGEFIGLLDSDDYVDLDFYEKLYNSAIKNNADIVKSKLYTHKLNGTLEKHHEIFEKIKNNKAYFNMCFSSAIYSRELLNKHNIRFLNNCIWGEDRYFVVLASYYCKNFYIEDSVVFHYVNRSDSVTVEMNEKKLASAIYSNEMIFNFINTNTIDKEDYKIIAIDFMWDLLQVLINSIKLQKFNTTPFYDKILKIFEDVKFKNEIFKENDFINFQYENLINKNIDILIDSNRIYNIRQQRKFINNLRNKHIANIKKKTSKVLEERIK